MIRTAISILNAITIAAVCSMPMVQSASAVTADVAKKCREVAIKAHPPTVAGSKAGAAQAERDSFRACVAQGGNVKDDAVKQEPKK
jgi:hypothetical protein